MASFLGSYYNKKKGGCKGFYNRPLRENYGLYADFVRLAYVN